MLGQCSPCEWGVLCAIAIWGLADVFRSAASDRWVFMTRFCLQKQKCSVYFSFQTRLEKLLAVPGAVQLFVKLFFYAVTGQQRKGGIGATDISRKRAIKAGKCLCPQEFCSPSLLIQVFFAVGS